jgi:hypothetical protein
VLRKTRARFWSRDVDSFEAVGRRRRAGDAEQLEQRGGTGLARGAVGGKRVRGGLHRLAGELPLSSASARWHWARSQHSRSIATKLTQHTLLEFPRCGQAVGESSRPPPGSLKSRSSAASGVEESKSE